MGNIYRFSGRRIREERRRRGLSIEEFAEGLGISAPFLGQMERDERRPSLTVFEKFLLVLGESPNSLMRPDSAGADLPVDRRIAALLSNQSEERKELILGTLKYILRRLARPSQSDA